MLQHYVLSILVMIGTHGSGSYMCMVGSVGVVFDRAVLQGNEVLPSVTQARPSKNMTDMHIKHDVR